VFVFINNIFQASVYAVGILLIAGFLLGLQRLFNKNFAFVSNLIKMVFFNILLRTIFENTLEMLVTFVRECKVYSEIEADAKNKGLLAAGVIIMGI